MMQHKSSSLSRTISTSQNRTGIMAMHTVLVPLQRYSRKRTNRPGRNSSMRLSYLLFSVSVRFLVAARLFLPPSHPQLNDAQLPLLFAPTIRHTYLHIPPQNELELDIPMLSAPLSSPRSCLTSNCSWAAKQDTFFFFMNVFSVGVALLAVFQMKPTISSTPQPAISFHNPGNPLLPLLHLLQLCKTHAYPQNNTINIPRITSLKTNPQQPPHPAQLPAWESRPYYPHPLPQTTTRRYAAQGEKDGRTL